uniref:Uncharacterized protein n=1 Tax=Sphaerodactylus townsendi TaxID=933632 RepID=A0ACB8E776_9SAUR
MNSELNLNLMCAEHVLYPLSYNPSLWVEAPYLAGGRPLMYQFLDIGQVQSCWIILLLLLLVYMLDPDIHICHGKELWCLNFLSGTPLTQPKAISEYWEL